jgi:hypothetical protein
MRRKSQTWDVELADIVKTTWSVGETFTMQGVYGRCESSFVSSRPDNHHVQQKLQQGMQHLHANGIVRRVSRGIYRRIL